MASEEKLRTSCFRWWWNTHGQDVCYTCWSPSFDYQGTLAPWVEQAAAQAWTAGWEQAHRHLRSMGRLRDGEPADL